MVTEYQIVEEKDMKKRKWFALAVTAALLVSVAGPLPVQAGSSQSTIDESSYATEINGAIWNNMDEDVLTKDGSLIFPAESTEATKLITKTVVESNRLCETVVKAEADITMTTLPEGEIFAMALGLGSTRANVGDEGNIELRFERKGTLKLSVVEIGEDEAEQVLLDGVSCGNVGKKVSVSAQIKSDKTLLVHLNGKEILESKLTSDGEGRIGFIQTGNCGAVVEHIVISTYTYSQPENCDMEEDFEKGYFNANYFQSELMSIAENGTERAYIAVEEYEGSNVLMFRNVGTGYLSSKMQYSNFEMTFDVPYIQRTDVMNEDGTVAIPTSDCFAVVVGAEKCDTLDTGNSSEMIVFYSDTVWLYFQDERFPTTNFEFRAPDETRAFSVKVSLVDSVLTVSMKWENETEWVVLGTTTLEMADGYVQLVDPSVGALNFAIDNLKIVNKDLEPNLKEVEYKSAKLNVPEDWNYEPITLNYENVKADTDGGFNWYWLIPIVAAGCVISVGVAVMITKRKKRKAGDGHEA